MTAGVLGRGAPCAATAPAGEAAAGEVAADVAAEAAGDAAGAAGEALGLISAAALELAAAFGVVAGAAGVALATEAGVDCAAALAAGLAPGVFLLCLPAAPFGGVVDAAFAPCPCCLPAAGVMPGCDAFGSAAPPSALV